MAKGSTSASIAPLELVCGNLTCFRNLSDRDVEESGCSELLLVQDKAVSWGSEVKAPSVGKM
ncbi:hypothetical protein EYF80_048264 [Liparis tanakae]|uniref:Uncharacterized protein n=1 Tax=Liparis tanakae TaxID=230148 RepID=A0A4Z2FK18_9TELE|nr:hypothetical protein EYF80_048264 [Liparis tanakae]